MHGDTDGPTATVQGTAPREGLLSRNECAACCLCLRRQHDGTLFPLESEPRVRSSLHFHIFLPNRHKARSVLQSRPGCQGPVEGHGLEKSLYEASLRLPSGIPDARRGQATRPERLTFHSARAPPKDRGLRHSRPLFSPAGSPRESEFPGMASESALAVDPASGIFLGGHSLLWSQPRQADKKTESPFIHPEALGSLETLQQGLRAASHALPGG